MKIQVDLDLGDLGYEEATVSFKYSNEPQDKGVYDIKCFVNLFGEKKDIYHELTSWAQQHIANQIYEYLDENPMGAA